MARRTLIAGISLARHARIRRGVLLAALALAAPIAMLSGASPASAGLQQEYEVFNDCPVDSPGVVGCVVSYTTSGEFTLGSKTVPINKTITLQGGTVNGSPELVPAADGNTLSKTPLQLPGGLVGVELLPPLTEVTATAELAGPVILNLSNFFAGSGPSVSLPLKAKLDNPSLGSSCYIGTDATPIEPQLTTGTTSPPSPGEPITGSFGKTEFAGDGNIVIVRGASLVDNTFAVPGASGCGGALSLLIDPGVNLVAGLPAAAGHNTAILNSTFENVSAALVKAQREIPEIGRCVKVEGEGKPKVFKGNYQNAGCTSPLKGAQYEWTTGPGPNPGFTVAGSKTTLETVGKGKLLTCTKTTGAGQYTGAKTATATLSFTGCKLVSSKEACQSSGAAPGEIVTSPLSGSLGFVKDVFAEGHLDVSVGIDLKHEPTLLTADCGASKVSVAGSIIAPFGTANKMVSSNALNIKATGSKQVPEQFEGGTPDTPVTTIGAGSPEQSGLTSKSKLTNEEKLEIKAETH